MTSILKKQPSAHGCSCDQQQCQNQDVLVQNDSFCALNSSQMERPVGTVSPSIIFGTSSRAPTGTTIGNCSNNDFIQVRDQRSNYFNSFLNAVVYFDIPCRSDHLSLRDFFPNNDSTVSINPGKQTVKKGNMAHALSSKHTESIKWSQFIVFAADFL